MKDFEASREYAYKMAGSGSQNDKKILYANISAYIDLFENDLAAPSEAMDFLELAMKTSPPEYSLEYNYFIAKIGMEHHLNRSMVESRLEYGELQIEPVFRQRKSAYYRRKIQKFQIVNRATCLCFSDCCYFAA